jgi:hypothetical protein
MSTIRYSDLIRHGIASGHDAGPDDYDLALREVREVEAWAVRHQLDRVAAVAQGLLTAILCLDPRDPVPSRGAPAQAVAPKPPAKLVATRARELPGAHR